MLPLPCPACVCSGLKATREILGETRRALEKLRVGFGGGRGNLHCQAETESELVRNLRNLAGPSIPLTDENLRFSSRAGNKAQYLRFLVQGSLLF